MPTFGTTPPHAYHLRVFLVSHCNFRCVYCNPDAERESADTLDPQELRDVVAATAQVGIRRIHYSGGEPTLYGPLAELMQHAQDLGFTEQIMTTNGYLLAERLASYVSAGLSRVTISIDTLDKHRFEALTGRDALPQVLEAIDRAMTSVPPVKLNMVVLRTNVSEIRPFLEWAHRFHGLVIPRFIELQENQPVAFDRDAAVHSERVSLPELMSELSAFGVMTPIAGFGDNPNCSYYAVGDPPIRVGVIANHSRGYPCGGCRKIRVSPYGVLGVCIGTEGIDVRRTTYADKVDAMQYLLNDRDKLDLNRPNRKHLSANYGYWRWGDVSEPSQLRARPVQATISARRQDKLPVGGS